MEGGNLETKLLINHTCSSLAADSKLQLYNSFQSFLKAAGDAELIQLFDWMRIGNFRLDIDTDLQESFFLTCTECLISATVLQNSDLSDHCT